MRHPLSVVALSLTLVLVGACNTIRPLGHTEPLPGQVLIAQLSEPIEFQVVEARLQNIMEVEGTLLTATTDSLVLAAQNLWSRSGVRHDALGARVAIARDNAHALQAKRLSGWRSGLLFVIGGAALAAAIFTVQAATSGSPPGGGKPPQQQ